MVKKFVNSIYETVVVENGNIYQELFNDNEVTEQTDEYWRNAIFLYNGFDENQKEVFFDILKQVMVDTISTVFGALDGSATLAGDDFDCEVVINSINTDKELQDIFLEFIEELEE